jgi:tetratricopeptide (TPR) repeat protein
MDPLYTIGAENLFVNPFQQQYQLEGLSNQALSKGIDLYSKKDYEGAATEFQRSINLSPNSDYAVDATKYLAQSYLKLEITDKAIAAYQNTLKRHPSTESLYVDLGNLFFSEDRFAEAADAYQSAVDINPSSTNQYSLGQGQLKAGNYGDAQAAFNAVKRLEPESAYGYFGLGQVYAQQKNYKSAVEQFETAINKQSDYYDAYLNLGYSYADMGDTENAKKLADYLEGKDDTLSTMLNVYINKIESPKMLFAWGSSTFRYSKTLQTSVAVLDSDLEDANASKTMNIKIRFSKDMDRASVENQLNWSISRAQGVGPAQTYNFGNTIPDTEVEIDPIPDFILYDSKTKTATVSFTLEQNSTADGTIDPSHIVFKFKGKDTVGNVIDSDYDEFNGFSGVA